MSARLARDQAKSTMFADSSKSRRLMHLCIIETDNFLMNSYFRLMITIHTRWAKGSSGRDVALTCLEKSLTWKLEAT